LGSVTRFEFINLVAVRAALDQHNGSNLRERAG
jgi:hypothetical protein